jgi:KTSC domain
MPAQPTPLFDMSKATPLAPAQAGAPLFDMSKAQPIVGPATGTAPKQPSTWDVITQPLEKTDKEYLGYTGPAGVAGATIHGLNDVARGTIGTVKGAVSTFDPRVQPGENAFTSNPLVRILRGLYNTAKMVPEIPGAIHDINQSVDPTGRYLDAAQDTASQGAGQALTAIATESAPKALGATSEIVKRTVPPVVRGVVKGANTVLEKAPAEVGAAAGTAVGHATHIPGASYAGGILGYTLGKTLLPKLRIPGEDFGLPKPSYPGAPNPDWPSSGEFVDSPQANETQPPFAPAEVVEPKLLPATASGVSRRMPGEVAPEQVGAPDASRLAVPVRQRPGAKVLTGRVEPSTPYRIGPGQIPPEDVSAPDSSQLAQRQGIRIVLPSEPKLLPAPGESTPASAATATTQTQPAATPVTPSKINDLLNQSLGYEPPPKPVPGKPIFLRPRPTVPAATPKIPVPEGMTPVESAAMRSYSYDEPSQTFIVQHPDGVLHKYGEVTPEEFQAFQSAESKGRALGAIRNNHVHLAANYGKGWINKAPAIRSAAPEAAPVVTSRATSGPASPTQTPDDLVGLLQQSVEAARSSKGKVAQK